MSGRHAAPKRSSIRRARTSGSETTNVTKYRSADTYRPHERRRKNKLLRRVGATALAAGILFGGGSSLLDKVDAKSSTTMSTESLEQPKNSKKASMLGKFGLRGFVAHKYNSYVASPEQEITTVAAEIPKPDFVYYSQFAPSWADVPYGNTGKTVKSSGCGPDSIAMIAASLTGNRDITPALIATNYGEHYIPEVGSNNEKLFRDVAGDYGLSLKMIEDAQESEAEIRETLAAGGYAIVSGKGGGYPFTESDKYGHILVIRGTNEEGNFLLGNPVPRLADQGKASVEVQANTADYDKGYSFEDLQKAGLHNSTYLLTKNES